jgi:flagellar FliL protein
LPWRELVQVLALKKVLTHCVHYLSGFSVFLAGRCAVMVDATMQEAIGENFGLRIASKRKEVSGNKLLLFIFLPFFLMMIGAAGLYLSGMLSSIVPAGGDGEAVAERSLDTVFYDLPEMLVHLNTEGRKSQFLKITVSLEMNGSEDVVVLDELQPRIVDSFQVYLRELRIEDLADLAGIQRLREGLLFRVNSAVGPAKISDVLFREMLVQ